MQPDPPKRVVDDKHCRLGAVATVPKPGQETDTVCPVAVSSFGYVEDELAHELARVAVSDNGAERGALHLCAEGFFELRAMGGGPTGRRKGLDVGIAPEGDQVVKVGLGVGAEQ